AGPSPPKRNGGGGTQTTSPRWSSGWAAQSRKASPAASSGLAAARSRWLRVGTRGRGSTTTGAGIQPSWATSAPASSRRPPQTPTCMATSAPRRRFTMPEGPANQADLRGGLAQDDFRARARAWLEANATRRSDEDAGQARRWDLASAREFQGRLHDAGFAGIAWPIAYGGQGMTPADQRAFDEEARDFDLPGAFFGLGLGMCGPTLLHLGTEEQKLRFIRPLLRAARVWCQLLSKPGAGRGGGERGDASREGGRRLGGQRSEGLDVGRAVRGPGRVDRSHRP